MKTRIGTGALTLIAGVFFAAMPAPEQTETVTK
jgi:hypothetical protein